MRKKRPRWRIRPEIFIIGAIIACAMSITSYEHNSRMNGLLIMDASGGISVCHDKNNPTFRKDEQALWEFEANTCRFIEVLNEDMESVYRMVYADIKSESIMTYMDEIDSNAPHNEPQMVTVDTPDGDVADLHYVWTTHPEDGRTYLFVQLNTHSAVKALGRFEVMCYVMVFLCILLAIVMMYWQCMGIINQYQQIRKQMEDE